MTDRQRLSLQEQIQDTAPLIERDLRAWGTCVLIWKNRAILRLPPSSVILRPPVKSDEILSEIHRKHKAYVDAKRVEGIVGPIGGALAWARDEAPDMLVLLGQTLEEERHGNPGGEPE